MLPILGWTKSIEAIVAGGELVSWIIYTCIITLLWIFADDIKEATESIDQDD